MTMLSLPTPYPVGEVNVFVLWGEALTLIDTGANTKESKEVLVQGLREIGITINDIEQIILTHHHIDHSGGLNFFQKDVPVYGHKNNQRWLSIMDDFRTNHDQFYVNFCSELGMPEELIEKISNYQTKELNGQCERNLQGYLGDGDSLPGLHEWKAIETLGHAQSQLSFYHEKDGVMIGGDQLLSTVPVNPIVEPPMDPGTERSHPLLQYNESLRKWMKLPISTLYAGHGMEIESVQELIKFRKTSQHKRAMHVKELISLKPSTGFEICQKLFPIMNRGVSFKLWETVGYLDYLEDLGEIKSEFHSGVRIYSIS